MKVMNMTKFYLLSLVFLLFLISCGVETPEAQITLAAPLHLVAENVFTNGASVILLQFDALNNESYFDGYNIYMSDNQNDLLSDKGSLILNSLGDKSKPTIPNLTAQSSASTFFFTVTTFTNNQPFISSNTYWFEVKAYSTRYGKASPPSNITNVQWLSSPTITN